MNSEFMGRFKAGNQQAFNTIYDEYFPRLSYFARGITKSEEEGQDIAINTFMKLWQRRGNFETEPNIKAFLFITARNACLDFLRQKSRRQEFLKDWLNYSEDYEPEHTNSMIKGEVYAQLRAEVEKLPKDCRKVFKMLYYEGKTPAEVAAELNISVTTVGTHRFNALKLLRKTNLKSRLLIGLLVLHWLEWLFRKLF